MEKLALALNVPLSHDESLGEVVKQLVASLNDIKADGLLTDPRNHLQQFRRKIENCHFNYTELSSTKDFNQQIMLISELYMELGLMKATLNSKLSLIDPLTKKTLKKQYVHEAIDTFNDMKECYELQSEISGGPIHSYCTWLSGLIERLENKGVELGKSVAFRPKTLLYEVVLRVMAMN